MFEGSLPMHGFPAFGDASAWWCLSKSFKPGEKAPETRNPIAGNHVRGGEDDRTPKATGFGVWNPFERLGPLDFAMRNQVFALECDNSL
jgi:hypothetical protein